MSSDLGKRIEELESRLAFQDDLIENLNDVIARQDRELLNLQSRLVKLEAKFDDLSESLPGSGDGGGHEVPPHY